MTAFLFNQQQQSLNKTVYWTIEEAEEQNNYKTVQQNVTFAQQFLINLCQSPVFDRITNRLCLWIIYSYNLPKIHRYKRLHRVKVLLKYCTWHTLCFISLFKELEVSHGQTWRRWPSSTRGVKTSFRVYPEPDIFSPSYPKKWAHRASHEHQSSAKQDWNGWNPFSGNATKTSAYVYREKEWKEKLKASVDLLLFVHSRCSMKGQEQVECKFYNELGRILVKDFPSVPLLDDIPEPEDMDFPSFTQQEIGKLKFSTDCGKCGKRAQIISWGVFNHTSPSHPVIIHEWSLCASDTSWQEFHSESSFES